MYYLILLLMVSSYVQSADLPIILVGKKVEEDKHKGLNQGRPMAMLFMTIRRIPEWSHADFNFKRDYQKVDFSVWYNFKDVQGGTQDIAFNVGKQLKERVATDDVLQAKLHDKYFCLGLVKHIQQKLPQCGHLVIANAMSDVSGFSSAIGKLSVDFWSAANRLSNCSLQQAQLSEDEFGFHCLKINEKEYIIDLTWTYFNRDSADSEHTILDVLMKNGSIAGVKILLETDIFDGDEFGRSRESILQLTRMNHNKKIMEESVRKQEDTMEEKLKCTVKDAIIKNLGVGQINNQQEIFICYLTDRIVSQTIFSHGAENFYKILLNAPCVVGKKIAQVVDKVFVCYGVENMRKILNDCALVNLLLRDHLMKLCLTHMMR